jgi:hypothetical protein
MIFGFVQSDRDEPQWTPVTRAVEHPGGSLPFMPSCICNPTVCIGMNFPFLLKNRELERPNP